MKKTYVKPMMGFESFELSTNIAQGCAYISEHELFACKIKIDEGVYIFGRACFSDGTYATQDNDTPCYDIPNYTNVVYTS